MFASSLPFTCSYGIQNDVDFVAASFVRKAEDVRSIRRFIEDIHSKFWPADHPTARIISKIENLGERFLIDFYFGLYYLFFDRDCWRS